MKTYCCNCINWYDISQVCKPAGMYTERESMITGIFRLQTRFYPYTNNTPTMPNLSYPNIDMNCKYYVEFVKEPKAYLVKDPSLCRGNVVKTPWYMVPIEWVKTVIREAF